MLESATSLKGLNNRPLRKELMNSEVIWLINPKIQPLPGCQLGRVSADSVCGYEHLSPAGL